MSKESLFKYIRSEDVVIWAGAGLSMYAGYPSGFKLAEMLIDELSDSDKQQINQHQSLPELAEEFCRLKLGNKNSLYRVLNKAFTDFIPTSTLVHDKIATIPHFKTIITTNYDCLFENAYKGKSEKIVEPKHIPLLDKDKTHIYKVHGDLTFPHSVIITKSDYNNFFKNDSQHNALWNSIRSIFASKNILFIGYSLEDPNVSVLFDKIADELSIYQKEAFFVAPNLVQHKINWLIQKGIHYINSTGEQLVDELIDELKENIVSDIAAKKISAETLSKFLLNYNLLPNIISTDNSYRLKSVAAFNGKIKGHINFNIKKDENFIKELNDFTTGKIFGKFEIGKDKLESGSLKIEGIKLIDFMDIDKLILKTSPKLLTKVDIVTEDGFEVNGISIELYSSPNNIEIHTGLNAGKIIFNLNPKITSNSTYLISYRYIKDDICKNVNENIEFYKVLLCLSSGKKIQFFTKTGEKFTHNVSEFKPIMKDCIFFLNYFENLKLIEKNFNVRFMNFEFKSIDQQGLDIVSNLISIIEKGGYVKKGNHIVELDLYDHSQENLDFVKELNSIKKPLVITQNIIEEIDLHGVRILLGYKRLIYEQCKIANMMSIINRKEITLKIKSKMATISYSVNEYDEFNGDGLHVTINQPVSS